jgi:hypothetical protein
MADPKTDEMRLEQIRRERDERARARAAEQDTEERSHERRAQRADYLRDRLDERAKSEERIGGDS